MYIHEPDRNALFDLNTCHKEPSPRVIPSLTHAVISDKRIDGKQGTGVKAETRPLASSELLSKIRNSI
jgi:hypothetical protein